ncbi:MAG: NAD-dependent epimerase/dehydratase family protein [Deltaproteobacteria bacterium]|nr:NAD-dependent epimerase/dehydratase family protein [Deltaproteobacteria bacterium]
MVKKIVVTGGSGRLGQLVIHELLSHDYRVLSLDRVPPAANLCPSWIADLRSSGHLYEALTNAYGVVHLGAYQAPGLAPDAEIFGNNVTASYNVLKAAGDLGVKKVVIASSTAAFGFIYAQKPFLPEYLPLDEKHPSRPQDPYGLSKVVGEQIAGSIVTTHSEMTICSLRLPGVNFDPNYGLLRERWKNPGARANTSWAYIDARDAATACRLALQVEFTGHEVMIVAAPTSSMREPTAELVAKYLDKRIPTAPGLTGNWSGVDSTKANKLLGFKAEHVWENYLKV